jgi:hypothetical protein
MHIGGEPVFFYWQSFAKFQPENMTLTKQRIFTEIFAQIRQIFYDKFQ